MDMAFLTSQPLHIEIVRIQRLAIHYGISNAPHLEFASLTPEIPTMFIALLLAAGQGRRFREAGGASWKLLADIGSSRTVLRQSCENLLAAGWPVHVVTGEFDAEIRSALQGLNVAFARNTDADAGLGSSIACGVSATLDADGWLVALGDMPFIQPDSICRVAGSLAHGAAITFPVSHGRRGHPVGFSRRFAAELMLLTGDTGAQSIVAPNKELWVPVEVDDEGVLRDIDVPGDLRHG